MAQDESLKKIEQEIAAHEQELTKLRAEYMARTGHMPIRKLTDFEWKWSVFMGLGFAFITMIVYLLGIAKYGKGSGTGIPSFFFSTDISYFAILTIYGLLAIMMVQAKKFSGFQSFAFILGFCCIHWLIYDWGWQFYLFGIGSIGDPAAFWQSTFGRDFLVVNPPMWLFLTEAIIGGCMAFFTFTFPRARRHLIPSMLWLYAVYVNATILEFAGVPASTITIVAVCLLVATFGFLGFFVYQRLKSVLPAWLARPKESNTAPHTRRKWKLTGDPLGFPFAIAMIAMVAATNLVLVLNPAIGLFFGLIPWFIVPIYYILINSTGLARTQRMVKIVVGITLTALFVASIIAVSILPLGDL
nr:hypothetical protein [Candidatus Sigynarchaeota archaeon]